MYRDNYSNTSVSSRKQSPQMLYRGLYVRIARKLGVDASYVSRVARGDRRSPEVESALRQALAEIDQQLGRNSAVAENSTERRSRAAKRLTDLIKQNRSRIGKEWLAYSQADPSLGNIEIPPKKRAAPILPVIEENVKAMKFSVKDIAAAPLKAAAQHGRLRQSQGFTPMGLVEEYNLVRRCVFTLAQENLRHMDAEVLIQDLTQFGEALDLQTQRALRDYLAAN